MSVTTLSEGVRKARKVYRCGLCATRINPGDWHHFQSNVDSDSAYTWRECLACHRDDVGWFIVGWSDPDWGADYETAYEWAADMTYWPRRHTRSGLSPTKQAEYWAAVNWLHRAGVAA